MNISVTKYTGIVYRAHHPKWAYTPLSGDGAKKYGGRFNQPGDEALYTSLDPTTAWMEAQQSFPFKPQPVTLVAYKVDCADIANLNDPELLQKLRISAIDLACAWEDLASQSRQPPTWRIAGQLQDIGVAGIIARSYAPGCTEYNHNLILWDWSKSPPHSINVIDDLSHLPTSIASWQNDKR